MKLHKLTCPNCSGILDIKFSKDTSSVFCPYCGQRFLLDDEKKEYTFNKNVRVDKTEHKRYTNDAEVIKAINEDKKDKRALIAVFACFALALAIPLILSLTMNLKESVAKNSGKVCAGYYQDLIGEDVKTVNAHFEAAGFTNIELIDLDDSGIAFWTDGEVKTISIGGDTSFSGDDYFDPDTKVVISYH